MFNRIYQAHGRDFSLRTFYWQCCWGKGYILKHALQLKFYHKKGQKLGKLYVSLQVAQDIQLLCLTMVDSWLNKWVANDLKLATVP